MEAARVLFVEKGYEHTSLGDIVERSGGSLATVYKLFGNKDGLYRSALETVYAEIRTQERSLNLGQMQPVAAMESLIGFSFDYLSQHPDFIGLLNHENAAGARHVRDSDAIRDTNSPLIELIAQTLARGIKARVFRLGVDPVEFYISVAGMSYFFFSNRLTLSSIFGRDLGAADAVAAYRRHVVAFAMAGLRP